MTDKTTKQEEVESQAVELVSPVAFIFDDAARKEAGRLRAERAMEKAKRAMAARG